MNRSLRSRASVPLVDCAHSPRLSGHWNPLAYPTAALTLVFLATCGQTLGTTTSRARSTATPLPVQLAWRAVMAPDGALTIAPGDGDIAYVCAVSSGSHVAVWVTRDRAAHWTRTADIVVRAGITQCRVTVDGFQPDIAAVAVTWLKLGASPQITDFASYVTFDGGRTWRSLAGPQPYLAFQFSTLNGATYGYLRVANGQQEVAELAASSDQMRTWHPIFQGVTESAGFGSTAFWLNPASGALLVHGMDAFWSSADAGAHWAKLTLPSLSATTKNVVVQAPIAGQPWHLCAANDDSLDPKNLQPYSLTCSTDGGRTWQTRPGLNLTFKNPPKGTFVYPVGIFAIASDGAILAVLIGPSTGVVYRLAAHARQWQSLGPTRGTNPYITSYPAPGSGVLWASSEQGWATADYR